MSLGVNDEVEDQITRCVKELGSARAIEVAEWRFYNGISPLMGFCAVGNVMMDMELKGVLAFVDGRYEVAQEVKE